MSTQSVALRNGMAGLKEALPCLRDPGDDPNPRNLRDFFRPARLPSWLCVVWFVPRCSLVGAGSLVACIADYFPTDRYAGAFRRNDRSLERAIGALSSAYSPSPKRRGATRLRLACRVR